MVKSQKSQISKDLVVSSTVTGDQRNVNLGHFALIPQEYHESLCSLLRMQALKKKKNVGIVDDAFAGACQGNVQ